MGLTFIDGEVSTSGGRERRVKFLVDSGATYTLLPKKDWQALKLKPKRRIELTLADGTTIARNVSECHIALAGHEGHTPVILGEPGDEPLLGVVTLEILGLMLDPLKRTIQSMQVRLG
jgi:clan AA aspartic protease